MAKVLYKHGPKESYLNLYEKNPSALYFCTDTRELFKGDDLYSDGLRIVKSKDDLPSFAHAAEGILYYCEDNGNAYVLSESKCDWILVIHGVDDQTIGYNSDGLLSVKEIPIDAVISLKETLDTIKMQGLVGSDEILISEDGVITISSVEIIKINGLEERLVKIEQDISDLENTDNPSDDPSGGLDGFEVVEF